MAHVLVALVAALSASAPGIMPSGAPAMAMRFGGGESAAPPAMFDAVGRLECRLEQGRARVRDATGWIVGGADTVVTAAHSLYSAGSAIDPRNCVFRLLNRDGSVRETARLVYVRSPWAEARYRNDSAHDVAVLKLDRPMAVNLIPAVVVRPGERAVRLVSFPADAGNGPARISAGEARPFPHGLARGGGGGDLRVTDPSRLFASSADSAAGSSGGLYYAPGARGAVGLHVGYVCAEGSCFNVGRRFDEQLLAMIAQVAADAVPADRGRWAQTDMTRATPVRALR